MFFFLSRPYISKNYFERAPLQHLRLDGGTVSYLTSHTVQESDLSYIESDLTTQACKQACLCSLNQVTLLNYDYYLAILRINSASLTKMTFKMS